MIHRETILQRTVNHVRNKNDVPIGRIYANKLSDNSRVPPDMIGPNRQNIDLEPTTTHTAALSPLIHGAITTARTYFFFVNPH